jgi:hypothetical protein
MDRGVRGLTGATVTANIVEAADALWTKGERGSTRDGRGRCGCTRDHRRYAGGRRMGVA